MSQLYIDQIINNPDNQIIIVSGDGSHILMGYIDAELTFGGSATYDNNSNSDMLEKASKTYNTVSSEMNKQAKTINLAALSKLSWQNSAMDGMSLNILLTATSANDNLLERAKTIFDFILPENGGKTLTPPMGYTAAISEDKTINAITVYIGDWFEGYGFVMTNASFTVSKEKVYGVGNQPLYVSISCELIPSWTMHKEEVKSMFIT